MTDRNTRLYVRMERFRETLVSSGHGDHCIIPDRIIGTSDLADAVCHYEMHFYLEEHARVLLAALLDDFMRQHQSGYLNEFEAREILEDVRIALSVRSLTEVRRV